MKAAIIVLWVIAVFFAYSLGRLYSAKEMYETCKEAINDVLDAARRANEETSNILAEIFFETIQNSDISLDEQEKIISAFNESIKKEADYVSKKYLKEISND